MFPKADKKADRQFEQTPAGNHVARLYQIVDLGMQRRVWQGEEKIQHQILLGFELCHEAMQDGRPFGISGTYTYSMNSKATLRRLLESWRGKAFDDAEAAEFDVTELLGKAAMLQVSHRDSGGKTYANIQSLASLPKGMSAPDAVNPLTLYSPEAHEQAAWERLPAWIQRRVAERVKTTDGFEDDEIPF